jgi:hypothetical protein
MLVSARAGASKRSKKTSCALKTAGPTLARGSPSIEEHKDLRHAGQQIAERLDAPGYNHFFHDVESPYRCSLDFLEIFIVDAWKTGRECLALMFLSEQLELLQ